MLSNEFSKRWRQRHHYRQGHTIGDEPVVHPLRKVKNKSRVDK